MKKFGSFLKAFWLIFGESFGNLAVLGLFLLAVAAFGQGASLQRGDALKRREYQTYSTQTFFIDPTGSDVNACTASGTSACLTWAGVTNKIPRHIRNAIIINIANGTYAEQMLLTDRTFAGNLTINGSQLTSTTLATGTATGTLTTVSTGAVAFSVYTDSGQTWTTNDLRFKFLTMTSGPASGQSVLIHSNTATTITAVAPFTGVPVAGNTYAITEPGAIFSNAAPFVFTGNLGAGIVGAGVVTVNNIRFTGTTGSNRWSASGSGVMQLTMNNSLITTTTGTFQAANNNVANVSNIFLTQVGVNCTSLATTGSCTSLGGAVLGLTGTYFLTSSTTALTVASGTGLSLVKSAFEATNTAAANEIAGVVSMRGPTYATAALGTNAFWSITCGAGMFNPGLRILGTGTGTSPFNASIHGVSLNALLVSGCPTGVSLGGQAVLGVTSTATFTDTVTGVDVSAGAKARFLTLPTFGGTFTNEFLLDSVSYTAAAINALTPKIVTNSVTLSSVSLQ